MNADSLRLATPAPEWEASYLSMVDEFIAGGEGYPYNNVPLAREDFAAFVRELKEEAAGIGLPDEVVPQQTWFLVTGNAVVGEIRFRPTVAPPYEAQNGHLAYNVRPAARNRGYATRGVALALEKARRHGLDGVSLTVEGENPASVRVIEKHGGKYLYGVDEDDVTVYWIELLVPTVPTSSHTYHHSG